VSEKRTNDPVVCPRCLCEIKTLRTVPHAEHECIDALKGEVARLTELLAESYADDSVGDESHHNHQFGGDL
jgi:hypothetical protein